MNFKRFHESKNLFDEEYPNMKADTPTYRSIYVGDGTFTLSTTTARYASSANLFFLAGNVGSGASTQNNGVWNGNPRTVTAVDGYVTIAYRYYPDDTNSDPSYNTVMLNSGSTPLPYEPYSSEVWHNVPHYIMGTDTDTITLPAVIYANDNNATIGLKGNMSQSGAPSPTTPIQPSECGERTGNLCGIAEQTITFTNLTVRVKDNCITFEGNNFSGEISSANSKWKALSFTLPAGTYYINKTPRPSPFTGMSVYIYSENGEQLASPDAGRNTFTLAEETICNLGFYVYLQKSEGTYTYNAMLNEGSAPEPYEPYGYKLDISSANTTTPVYLGEVQSTRRIKKLVLTGEESWDVTSGNAPYLLRLSDIVQTSDRDIIFYMSTHYPAVSNNASWAQYNACVSCTFSGGVNIRALVFRDTNQATFADFKAYLAQQYASGTPVTIWYVLATPETAVVNEPLCKIGTYADSISGISIPTIAGANTISVDTTLQPSEVTATYKGWHPVTDVHERENGAWT